MAGMNDLRNGMVINWRGKLWEVVEFLHVKPGKGAAFVRSKIKDVMTGQVIENTWRSSDKFDEVRIEKVNKQYLYFDGSFYVFMDNDTYEQMSVPEEVIGDIAPYMIENIEVWMRIDPNGKIIGIELPITIEMEITECEPNVKGNTASGGGKGAVTQTGLKVTVPFFIEVGDHIKIDTRSGEYLERV